jgi:CheY-like chemotaxis protein
MSSRKRLRIFSALEVANICGVVNQTTINWIKTGHLKAFITPGGQYRVYIEDLVSFLKERGMRVPEELDSILTADVDPSLVLIVDDDKDLNAILKRIIERKFKELRAIQAYDGFEAGKLLAERHPALVFLDVDLPGMDGISLCSRIRADPSIGHPTVIAMTGLDKDEVRDNMLKAGADAFYSKPLDFEAIIARIAEVLESRADT